MMPPHPRYTVHENSATGEWAVYDNLRQRTFCSGFPAWVGTSVACAKEDVWRRQCARWTEAAHRDGGRTR